MDAADIDPADECGPAVDNKQFAVIAIIDQPWRLRRERVDRVEFEHLDPAFRGRSKKAFGVLNAPTLS